jgi:hypothetical protein
MNNLLLLWGIYVFNTALTHSCKQGDVELEWTGLDRLDDD